MFLDQNFIPNPTNSYKSIGRKESIIPGKLMKVIYREGEGKYAKENDAIYAYYRCYMASGKEIIKTNNNLRRLVIGIGRLIEGLQIGLKTARIFEIFTLIISPELAYQEIQDIQIIPKKQKLIFQFEIVSIQKLQIQQKSQVQDLSELRRQLQDLRKLVEENKINLFKQKIEEFARNYIEKPFFRLDLQVSLLIKYAHLNYLVGNYEHANQICEKISRFQPFNLNYIALHCYVLQRLENRERAVKLLQYILTEHKNDSQFLQVYKFFMQRFKMPHSLEKIKDQKPKKYQKSQINQKNLQRFMRHCLLKPQSN